MSTAHSLSVIIPAFNEQDHIHDAVQTVMDIAGSGTKEYEIILINDGSTDQTPELVNALAREYSHMHVHHHPQNRGLGESLKTGVSLARHPYVTWFPGDNSVDGESMENILRHVGRTDIVIAYMANVDQRRLLRKILSRAYTGLLNGLFDLKLRYYNGPSVFKTKLLRTIKWHARGHDCFAEILIRSIHAGHSYCEVPFIHNIATEQYSRALSCHNVRAVACTVFRLVKDMYIRRVPTE